MADAAHVMVWGADAPLTSLWAGAGPGGAGAPESWPAGPGDGGEPHRFGELARRLWAPLLAAEKMDMP